MRRPDWRRLRSRAALSAVLVIVAATLFLWGLARADTLPSWHAIWAWFGRWWPAVLSTALFLAALVAQPWRPRPGAGPPHRDGRWASVTDRYTKAIDQLGTAGSEHLAVRVGGIFALERLAIDSPRDQRTIVEVLGAFIRTNSRRASPTTRCPKAAAGIEAAFAVLTRRDTGREKSHPLVIDLRNTCLAGVRADGADLTGVSLIGSDLHDATMPRVHGRLVGLTKVSLANANLIEADLTDGFIFADDADLTGADLYLAHLRGIQLTRVKLVKADLSGADLRYADFTDADLTGAKHDSDTRTSGATYDAATKGAWW